MIQFSTRAVLLGLAICIGGPSPILALTINVSVNGTPVPCPASSSPCNTWFDLTTVNPVTIPGLKYAITNGSAGAARIIVDDTSGQDVLRLENAVFTATGAFSGNTLNFWATFNNPPTTAGSNVVNFWRRAQGQFIRAGGGGAPILASLTVNGMVTSMNVVGPQGYTVPCGACGNFTLDTTPNFLQFIEPPKPLNTSHENRGAISNFKLNTTGDVLQLNEFKVWSTAGVGEDATNSGYTYGEPSVKKPSKCKDKLDEDCPAADPATDKKAKKKTHK